MSQYIIRNEEQKDYRAVEELTREAFWNIYEPGCTEHYMVHMMRSHPDFVPELDLVAELDGKIIGSIVYAKSKLADDEGNIKDTLTFGPISIALEYQRKGIGKKLQEASFQKAIALGYDSVVIFGSPLNYISSGFKSCKKYNVCLENGKFPSPMLVKELIPNTFDGRRWRFYGSETGNVDREKAEEFDKSFVYKEKRYQYSQEEFYIFSHSVVE